MSRVLAMNTTIDDVTYPAGSTPPKDVADRITNPKAWKGLPGSSVTKLAAKQAEAEARAAAAEGGAPEPDTAEQPPEPETADEDFTPTVEDAEPFSAPADGPEPVPDLDDDEDEPEEKPAKPARKRTSTRKRS